MVAKTFQKNTRNRLIRRIVLAVIFILIAAFILLAYLGTNLGDFTIELKKDQDSISLSDNYDFKNPSTVLRADSLKEASPISVEELPSDDKLDAIFASGNHGGKVTSNPSYPDIGSNGNYLAYTFYLKNTGPENTLYDMTMQIGGLSLPMQGTDETRYYLDEIVRVRLYENKIVQSDGEFLTTHNSSTYAKQTRNFISGEGKGECIGGYLDADYKVCRGSDKGKPYGVRAESFYSNDTSKDARIIFEENKLLLPKEIVRFTIVLWLEGDDPECFGQIPEHARMDVGMTFAVKSKV